MGSSGAKKAPDEFGGALGTRNYTKSSFDDAMTRAKNHEINPNYSQSSLYRTNCALCSTAFALNARGYDVEAQPRDTTWRGFGDVFQIDYGNTDNYILNSSAAGLSGVPGIRGIKAQYPNLDISTIQKMPRGSTAVARKIVSQMKSWGDGSIAVMNVKWKGGNSAHAVNVVNDKGVIRIVDSQNGRTTANLQSYLSQTVANHTQLVRVDNATVRTNIKNLDKMVKRRSN